MDFTDDTAAAWAADADIVTGAAAGAGADPSALAPSQHERSAVNQEPESPVPPSISVEPLDSHDVISATHLLSDELTVNGSVESSTAADLVAVSTSSPAAVASIDTTLASTHLPPPLAHATGGDSTPSLPFVDAASSQPPSPSIPTQNSAAATDAISSAGDLAVALPADVGAADAVNEAARDDTLAGAATAAPESEHEFEHHSPQAALPADERRDETGPFDDGDDDDFGDFGDFAETPAAGGAPSAPVVSAAAADAAFEDADDVDDDFGDFGAAAPDDTAFAVAAPTTTAAAAAPAMPSVSAVSAVASGTVLPHPDSDPAQEARVRRAVDDLRSWLADSAGVQSAATLDRFAAAIAAALPVPPQPTAAAVALVHQDGDTASGEHTKTAVGGMLANARIKDRLIGPADAFAKEEWYVLWKRLTSEQGYTDNVTSKFRWKRSAVQKWYLRALDLQPRAEEAALTAGPRPAAAAAKDAAIASAASTVAAAGFGSAPAPVAAGDTTVQKASAAETAAVQMDARDARDVRQAEIDAAKTCCDVTEEELARQQLRMQEQANFWLDAREQLLMDAEMHNKMIKSLVQYATIQHHPGGGGGGGGGAAGAHGR
ncbi:hypothetical protein HK405_015545, partial [Cladochytrium tenue]